MVSFGLLASCCAGTTEKQLANLWFPLVITRYDQHRAADLNKNNKWDGIPIDKPISNTIVFLVQTGVKKRASNLPLSNTTTDALGGFILPFPPQNPGTDLAIVKDLITRDPLSNFKASSDGGAPDALIPVPRPTKVSFSRKGSDHLSILIFRVSLCSPH